MSSPLEELRQIVERLRAPGGCPWDREQTHESMRNGLIEEAYEVLDAIDRKDDAHFREELGDFLLQVVMHCQIASEEGRFDLDQVARELNEKLIRRHPHVFGENKLGDTEAVLEQWDKIKRQEKAATESVLDGVIPSLPALMHAEKIQKRAARVGFDWDNIPSVIAKVREELEEIEQALAAGNSKELEKEIGDLLFSAVNLARKAKVDAELTLRDATGKFSARFRKLEAAFAAEGRSMKACSLAELDEVWDRIKRQEEATQS